MFSPLAMPEFSSQCIVCGVFFISILCLMQIDLLTTMDMPNKALLAATDATTAHPGEIDLWSKRLNLQISLDADLHKLQEILKTAKQHVPEKVGLFLAL